MSYHLIRYAVCLAYCCLVGTGWQESIAQSEPSATDRFYFASNSAQLSPQATRLLDSILALPLAGQRMEVCGFTDDRGSADKNRLLAYQRAEVVRAYLIAHAIDSQRITIVPHEQIRLAAGANDAARAEARRAELRRFAPLPDTTNHRPTEPAAAQTDALRELFAGLQAEQTQHYSFAGDKPVRIVGKEGSVLDIPADAFVDASGKPYTGQVQFVLREAYDYGDMIIQGLTTMTADGQPLETGGMIYTEALDDKGMPLTLATGKDMLFSSPAPEANKEGMALYAAVKNVDGYVEWMATDSPIERNAAQARRADSSAILYRFLSKRYKFDSPAAFRVCDRTDCLAGLLDSLTQTSPDFVYRLPRPVAQPKKVGRAPAPPRLYPLDKPDRSALAAQYPQQSKETTAQYNRRIYGLYSQKMDAYTHRLSANRQRSFHYRRDSSAYIRQVARYTKDSTRYAHYNTTMTQHYTSLHANMQAFSYDQYRQTANRLSRLAMATLSLPDEVNTALRTMRDDGTTPLWADSILAQFDQTSQSVAKMVRLHPAQRKGLETLVQVVRTANNNFYRTVPDRKTPQWESMRKQVKRLEDRIAERGDTTLRRYDIQRTRALYGRLHTFYNLKGMAMYSKRVANLLRQETTDLRGTIQKGIEQSNRLQDACAEITMLQKRHLIDGMLTGTANTLEFVPPPALTNQVPLRSTGGWNIDRPLPPPPPLSKERIELLADYDNRTLYYALSENSRSARMFWGHSNRTKYILEDIDQAAQIKVIGVRIQDGQPQTFVQTGSGAALKRLTPDFQPATIDELKQLLSAL